MENSIRFTGSGGFNNLNNSIFNNPEAAEMADKNDLENLVHKYIIHRFLGLSCEANTKIHGLLKQQVKSFIQKRQKENKNWKRWSIRNFIKSLNNSTKINNPPKEVKELIAFLYPFHKQLKDCNSDSLYLKCLEPKTLRVIPGPEYHVDVSNIKTENWLKSLEGAGILQGSCFDFQCRGSCGSPYALNQENIQKIDEVTEKNTGTERIDTNEHKQSKDPITSTPITPLIEEDLTDCDCGLDHSSTQPIDKTTQKNTSDNDISRENNSHSCNDPNCNINHSKESNQNSHITSPVNHRTDNHSAFGLSKKNYVILAWGIIGTFTFGLIAWIMTKVMNETNDSENLINSNVFPSSNRTQISNKSVKVVITK
ncbi:MAG: hypothetical protein QNJ31_04255 [Candidatus Caenarcaniphilales bacterium]|nr:hypothetical protein [Candidatus Caenarcaniphilales bacterium]